MALLVYSLCIFLSYCAKYSANMKDITNIDIMLELQGDAVLATLGKENLLLTIVHFADETGSQLQLVDRRAKAHDAWPLLQEIADMLVPNKTPDAKWLLKL